MLLHLACYSMTLACGFALLVALTLWSTSDAFLKVLIMFEFILLETKSEPANGP